jgi:hypothetical protein
MKTPHPYVASKKPEEAAAAAEAVEVAAEAVVAVTAAVAGATDAGAAAAVAAVYHGAAVASVRLERLSLSARNANHVGRAWPGQSCFVSGVAHAFRGSSRCTVVSVIGRAYQ